jgi:hypothetical protein
MDRLLRCTMHWITLLEVVSCEQKKEVRDEKSSQYHGLAHSAREAVPSQVPTEL